MKPHCHPECACEASLSNSAHARPQCVQTEQEAEANLHRLRESLSSVEDVLYHTTAPNMKALEKVREVKDKFQGVAEGNFCSLDPAGHHFNTNNPFHI